MKKRLLLPALFFLLQGNLSAQWTWVNGPNDGVVYALSLKNNDLWLWGKDGIEKQNTDQLNWSLPLIFSNQMDWERYQTIYHFKNAVFIREEFGNVLRTLDGGQTWTNVTPGSIVPISHVVKFEQKNDTLYFLAEFGRTWQTTDLGDHWEQISAGINAQIGENMSDLTVQGSQVFINGGGNIYRSEDNLQSWQLVADSMQLGAATPWIGLSATSHYLSAWVNYERFFVSNDQGQNWLEGSFPFPPFFAQTYDDRFYFAEIGNVLVAVFQHGGAFVSSDQGGTWQDFNQGIPNIESTTTFAKNDSTLWLGTRDFGLFKRSISDLPTVSTSQPLSEQNVLKIFPNPTQGAFSCKIPLKISGEATLTVFDLQGKQMLRRTDSTEHLPKIDLSRCAKGVYWVSIATPQGVFGGKVVVQ